MSSETGDNSFSAPHIKWQVEKDRKTERLIKNFAAILRTRGITISNINITASPIRPDFSLSSPDLKEPLELQIANPEAIDRSLPKTGPIGVIDNIVVATPKAGIGTKIVTTWEQICGIEGIHTMIANHSLSQAGPFWEGLGYISTTTPGQTYRIKRI